jgi:hypothetical protein
MTHWNMCPLRLGSARQDRALQGFTAKLGRLSPLHARREPTAQEEIRCQQFAVLEHSIRKNRNQYVQLALLAFFVILAVSWITLQEYIMDHLDSMNAQIQQAE